MSNPKHSKSPNEYVICTCPMCGIIHNVKMFWTGTCTPRKYCPEHQKIASRMPEYVARSTPYIENGRIARKPTDQGQVDL